MSGFSLIFIVIIFGGMFFFMQRSQKKQRQQREEQLNSMQVGSDVVTIGGLHGKLAAINSASNTIDIDCEGVILTFDKAAIKTINAPAAPQAVETAVEETKAEAEATAEKMENPIEENK
ncbi:preprotein translocase subunit YajC [Lactococcus termiticola]|uniref:Preprotein translocase subunit YajC n=1 Tax=Lactococcus termiticola TaxID=2169526 RepID=A0A2R5HKQ1_9LACT|nr:preprotein translocase subunit YajC [Lactococcus termiticola]GBG97500.1 preprotein translocase subunit YajC [Lactococcus termiticola]